MVRKTIASVVFLVVFLAGICWGFVQKDPDGLSCGVVRERVGDVVLEYSRCQCESLCDERVCAVFCFDGYAYDYVIGWEADTGLSERGSR